MIFFYVGITNIVLVFFNVIFVTLLLQMIISVHNLRTQGVSVHEGIPVHVTFVKVVLQKEAILRSSS